MSNIAKAFAGGKAFIPFITCGDPDMETTAAVVRAAPTRPLKAPSYRARISARSVREPQPTAYLNWFGNCAAT